MLTTGGMFKVERGKKYFLHVKYECTMHSKLAESARQQIQDEGKSFNFEEHFDKNKNSLSTFHYQIKRL